MAIVTLDQMKSQLLTIDQVIGQLQKTEPLTTTFLSSDSKIKFKLDHDWAHGLDALEDTDLVGAEISVNGQASPLTKEALFQAAVAFSISKKLLHQTPAHYMEGLLNYFYGSGMGDSQQNMLTVAGRVVAFTSPTKVPFSNVALLESVVSEIQHRQGDDTPVFADYKFQNTLQQTNVRLIVPTEQRVVHGGDMYDVPDGSDDVWLAGIHLSNSVIGKSQTHLEGYLFRYWCTNGMTTELDGVQAWDRRINGQNDDVYQWARDQVDAVLGGLESSFDAVQGLTSLRIEGNTGEILSEIFKEYEVPVSQRVAIQDELLTNPDNLTMYALTNAITRAANEEGLADRRRDRLMRIGGAIPTEQFNPLKARIWAEGHTADESTPNPYEIRAV